MSQVAPRLNVFGLPLQICSTSPITGFLRNGYCDSLGSDYGKHFIAAEVTDEFLEYSAQQGNDLRQAMPQPDGSVVGLKGGCKWCLCVSRWMQAFKASEKLGDRVVPKVLLDATHIDALKSGVTIQELQKHAKSTQQEGHRFDVGR